VHPVALADGHLAIGGGGIGSLLVHLFIWHLIFRFFFAIWHIHTFGPIIVAVIVAGLVTLAILRSRRGRGWWRPTRAGSSRYGSSTGPRDW
jgi:hypothetical protein